MENPKTIQFEVNLQWNSDTKGTLSSPVLPNPVEVATPPEFTNGIKDIWTPEHLFVAAVNACFMATFLAVAQNSKFEFVNYSCNAIGRVDTVEGHLAVIEIILKPTVSIPNTEHEDHLNRIFELSKKACAITNSIKTNVVLQPNIEFF
jgi:organic hydroperoxide reductase OsmC/OhrA